MDLVFQYSFENRIKSWRTNFSLSPQLYLFLFFIFLTSSFAEARIFDLSKENFAVFVRGTYGDTYLSDTPYKLSSGGHTLFTTRFQYEASGEFGFVIKKNRVAFRSGLELIYPRKLESVEGSDNSGQLLLTVTSQVIGVHPNGVFEYALGLTPSFRFFIFAGAGYAMVTSLNEYKLTNAGKTLYPGVVDYTEEGEGYGLSGQGGLGMEFVLADAATVVFEAGHRHLQVSELIHKRDGRTIQGSISKGEVLKQDSGIHRSYDLSSTFFGMSLRFYF